MTTNIAGVVATRLPTAAFDIGTFLKNATSTLQGWGVSLLILLGCVGIVWAGVLLILKLTASPQKEQQQAGWGKIALLLLVGGALFTGGFNIVQTVSSGGQRSIEDLGRGTIVVSEVAPSGGAEARADR